VVAVRGAGRLLDVGVRGVKPAVADVLANAALEEPGVLEHHGEVVAQVVTGEVTDVVGAYTNGAAANVVEAHEELDEGRLASTGRTDDGHRLAWIDVEREVVDDVLVRQVAKAHVLERDGTLVVREGLPRHVGVGLLGGVEKLEDAFRGGDHLLDHVGDVGELRDGLREVAHVLDEGLDVTDGDAALHGKRRAHDHDAHVAEVAHEGHGRLHEPREKLALPRALVERIVASSNSSTETSARAKTWNASCPAKSSSTMPLTLPNVTAAP